MEGHMKDKNGTFEKRVKRRITGRAHSFFAATAPGLETLCLSELRSLPLSEKDASVVSGGVAFRGRLHDCYLANLHLRSANRVLMRIADFRASGFPTLERKLADIDWELFLPPGGSFRISVASSKSRLYHRGAVAQRVKESIDARMGQGGDSSPEARIFVRAESDRFTVSLDSSGELLYKRGIKSRGGKAPIRETLAAAVLAMAGYRPGRLLVDPMCGSGTFSLEAAMICRNMPAGWFRGFAFEGWPAFSPSRWRHVRREAEADLKAPGPCIFASDQEETAVRLLGKQLADHGLSDAVTLEEFDFFKLTREILAGKMKDRELDAPEPGLIVLNPPYGRRLGSLSESRNLIESIFRKLRKDFNGWDAAVIVPRRMAGKRMTSGFRRTPLFHGGLDLVLLTGKITD
jgi:putative N6-adenine-specific DNA methylase